MRNFCEIGGNQGQGQGSGQNILSIFIVRLVIQGPFLKGATLKLVKSQLTFCQISVSSNHFLYQIYDPTNSRYIELMIRQKYNLLPFLS